jgi:putative NIF3 family GTP cyclohydrolase 1 type 2
MKTSETHEYLKSLGAWVDWSGTNDKFLHGDPEVEIERMAITWIPTIPVLKEAVEKGANVLLTHEPCFYPGYAGKWRDHPYPLAAERAESKWWIT